MGSFGLLHWVIFGGLVYIVVKAFQGSFGGKGKISATASHVCTACGTRCEPEVVTRGNLLIELILWLCFLVPGLIYSIWRLSTRHKGCPACGSASVIPANTPMGEKLLNEVTK